MSMEYLLFKEELKIYINRFEKIVIESVVLSKYEVFIFSSNPVDQRVPKRAPPNDVSKSIYAPS